MQKNKKIDQILNGILHVLHHTTIKQTVTSDQRVTLTIYLGYKEVNALKTMCPDISPGNPVRIQSNGSIKVYNFDVVPVLKETYMRATASIDLKQVYPSA